MNKKVTQEKQDGLSHEEIETKILHLLRIYPIISPTMLQSGLGPSTRPSQWRPVLIDLIAQGKVIEEQESMQTPSERYNTYSKLSLAGTTVSVGE
jgi:hypothetical protein